tara:strand:+ start:359 stop:1153 length:795 start_codon:yes stop_codon:yes gene_type:complete
LSKLKIYLSVTIILVLLTLFLINYIFFFKTNFRVLHAGGIYKDEIHTNSLVALDKNKKGFKYLELDFQMTTDKKLVCLHDLKNNLSYDNFLKDNIIKNVKNCDYISLSNWLIKNPNKIIITDVKSKNNLEALEFIKNNFKNYNKVFIPQIYNPENYESVKKLGYEKIIWTLYRYGHNNFEEIINIIKKNKYFAITITPERARSGLSKEIRKETNTNVLVHTINFRRDRINLIFLYDVTDVYTDRILFDVNNIFSWFLKKRIISD